MGVISILLGIIFFLGFTGGGAILANILTTKEITIFGEATTLVKYVGLNNTQVMVIIIAVCACIGLLIGMNLIMLGINHNKLSRIQKLLKRRKRG